MERKRKIEHQKKTEHKKKIDENLKNLIESARDLGFPPALQLSVHRQGRPLFQEKFGYPYKFWDVASLTKILVTTPLLMKLWEEGRVNLERPLSESLSFLEDTPVGRIETQKLLSHSSGLEWWRPFFKKLMKFSWQERDKVLKGIFQKEKTKNIKKCVYSDLDFILLGWLVEEKLGLSLDEAAQIYIFGPLGLKNTFFLKHQERLPASKKTFAPTEKHAFRGLLQGVVFDDNAWSMGGVSGHAGLFSTLEDVSRLGTEFWKISRGEKGSIVKSSAMLKFSKRATPKSRGDWALGFSIPSINSTGGRKISADAFGHTGFPGTSLWIDRKRDTVVTILSNRTFPTRDDNRFLELRKNIHDRIWEIIDDND